MSPLHAALRGRRLRKGLGLALALMAAPLWAAADGQAHFVVQDRVIAPDPGAFGATVNGIGNGADFLRAGSGFEPVIYRDWFRAVADAPDRAIAARGDISRFDTLRTGALDGAEVEILRIENGAFRQVRRAVVPEGGYQVSGWLPTLPKDQVIPAKATSFTFAWDAWNRPGVPYYFTLRSIDQNGTLSEPSAPVRAVSPAEIPKRSGKGQRLTRFKPPKGAAGGQRPAAPRDLRARVTPEGRVALSWTPARGRIAGYVLERSDVAPERQQGFFVALEGGGEAVKKGDLVILRKRVTDLSREKWLSNRVWNALRAGAMIKQPLLEPFADEDPDQAWRLRPHAPGTAVEEAGETYLELALAEGTTARIGRATDSGTAQDFYPVLEPGRTYRLEVWLKADRPTALRFQLTGFHAEDAHRVEPQELKVGTRWKKHTVSFSPRALNPGEAPGRMILVARGPVTLSIDNFRVFRADAAYMDLLPEEYAQLEASGMSALRIIALAATRQTTYDLAQLTDPAGLPTGTKQQNSLPQSLRIAETAKINPWLLIEPHFSKDEWLGLVEYLAAPTGAGRPWAAKRAAQGRKAPWTEAFDTIYLETGIETWNRHFAPWVFRRMTDAATGEKYSPGAVYGLYQDYVGSILRRSPYWTPAIEQKIVTVLAGWEVKPRFGTDAARRAPSAGLLTTAPYIGGWEAKAAIPGETPEDFFRLLNHVERVSLPRAGEHLAGAAKAAETRGRAIRLGTYEAGPGYVHKGPDGTRAGPAEVAQQDRVMKSLAAGTATLDSFLARAAAGYGIQNYHRFGTGPLWNSHATPQKGGQAYPSWTLLSLFNREATGDFLAVETRAVPRADLAPVRRRQKTVRNAPLIGAYATRSGDRLALILTSRRVPGYPERGDDGSSRVRVDLPVRGADRLRRFRLDGRYDDHNVVREAVTLAETGLDPAASLPRLEIADLPPGATHIYVFEGVR